MFVGGNGAPAVPPTIVGGRTRCVNAKNVVRTAGYFLKREQFKLASLSSVGSEAEPGKMSLGTSG